MKISKFCILILSPVIVVLSSCTMGSVDKVTSEERELRVISNFPVEAVVPIAKFPQQWRRAELFAEQYLGTRTTIAYENRNNQSGSVTLKFQSEHYLWSVSRQRRGSDAFLLSVSCLPLDEKSDKSAADLNARNLARFIAEGRLQLSLLKK